MTKANRRWTREEEGDEEEGYYALLPLGVAPRTTYRVPRYHTVSSFGTNQSDKLIVDAE